MFTGPHIVTDGLALYLDAANPKSYSGTGTTWYDKSGNGNNGTLINGPTFDSGNGGSIVFDGVNDYTTINYPVFTSPTELTIGGFFTKLSGGATYETVLHQGANTSIGTSAYWFGVDLNDKLVATIGATTGVGWAAGQTATTAVYGAYYYLVASWNGTTVSVYINGVFNKSYSLSTYSDPGTVTRIGASGDASGYLFSGNVGIVHIYTKALTAQEVLQNYNATKSRFNL